MSTISLESTSECLDEFGNAPMPDVLVYLIDNCLIFANVGAPFSPAGIEAVCTEHRSSKRVDDTSRYADKDDADRHIDSIRARHVREYSENTARLYEDFGSESESRKDYGGRVLLELFQNADDAHSSLQIGHKGLGFKSVLNISENPRIYSGHVAIEFSRERARGELIDAEFEGDYLEEVPILRLPHQARLDKESPLIQRIVDRFDTTIILPIALDDARHKKFLEHWDETANDPSLLLFLHTLTAVQWITGDERTRWEIQRGESVQTICISGNEISEEQDWLIQRQDTCALAVRLAGNHADTTVSYPYLRSYFPTTEPNPFPAVLAHLELDLKQDRDRFRWELDPERTSNVLTDYTLAFKKLVEYCDDAGTILDLIHVDTDFAHAEELANAVYSAVREMLVPGLTDVTWGEVHLAPRNTDRTRSGDLQTWELFKLLIGQNDQDVFSALRVLPIGVDTVSRETVLEKLSLAGPISIDEISKAKLFINSNNELIDASSRPVFEVQESTRLPGANSGCVSFETVEFDYQNKLGETSQVALEHLKGFIRALGISAYSPISVIEKAVLPVLNAGEQDVHLVEFLFDILKSQFGPNANRPFSWRNSVQTKLATLLQVRDRDGVHRNPSDMYFGRDWGASGLIEQIYGGKSDRGILHAPSEHWDEKDLDRWTKFYSWLGVSHFPKILPLMCFSEKPETKEGPIFDRKAIAQFDDPPENWEDYCKDVAGQFFYYDPVSYKSRMRTNWQIDIQDAELRIPGVLELILQGWDSEYSSYLQSRCYCSTNMNQDRDNREQNIDAYWLWRLRSIAWVSVGDARHHSLREIFMTGEVTEALQHWVFKWDPEGFEEAAERLGIRRHWSDVIVSDWENWFFQSLGLDCDSESGKESRRAVEQLYRHFLNRSGEPLQDIDLWSLERNTDGSESWTITKPRSDVYFVDWPQHEKLRLPGLYRFPVSLGNYATRAEEKLDILPLSKHLSVEIESLEMNVRLEAEFNELLLDRKHYLIAYLMTFSRRETHELSAQLEDLSIHAFHNLSASYALDDEVLATSVSTDYIYSPSLKVLAIDVDRAQSKGGELSIPGYEALAWGIVYVLRISPRHHSNVKDIISYPSEGLHDKLLDLGVTLADIEYWEGQKASITHTETDEDSRETIDVDEESPNQPQPLGAGEDVDTSSGIEKGTVGDSQPDPEENGSKTNDDRGRLTALKGEGVSKTRRAGGSTQGTPNRGNSEGKAKSAGSGPGFINSEDWKRAEKYVREYLSTALAGQGWSVSAAPVRDEKLAETDILLSHRDHEEIHVEVKHLRSNVLFWSELEFGKSQEHRGRYFMVLVTESSFSDSGFEAYWSFDPESDLATAVVRESWRWYRDKASVGSLLTEWIVSADRPKAEADGYAFRIELESFNSHDLVPGIDAVLLKIPESPEP